MVGIVDVIKRVTAKRRYQQDYFYVMIVWGKGIVLECAVYSLDKVVHEELIEVVVDAAPVQTLRHESTKSVPRDLVWRQVVST